MQNRHNKTRDNVSAMKVEPLSKKPYLLENFSITKDTIFQRKIQPDQPETDIIVSVLKDPKIEQQGFDKKRTEGAKFKKVTFSSELLLAHYSFKFATFDTTTLSLNSLKNSDFSSANLRHANFENTSFCQAKFIGTHFNNVSFGKFDENDKLNSYGVSKHAYAIFFNYQHKDLPSHIETVLNHLIGEDENDSFELARTGTVATLREMKYNLAREENNPEVQQEIQKHIENFSVLNNSTTENIETLRAMVLHSLAQAIAKNDDMLDPITQFLGSQGLGHKFFADATRGHFNLRQYAPSLIRGLITTNSLANNREASFATHKNALILCTYLLSILPKLTSHDNDILSFFLKLKPQLLNVVKTTNLKNTIPLQCALKDITDTRRHMPGRRPGKTQTSKELDRIIEEARSTPTGPRASNFCGTLFSCCNPKNQTVGPDAPISAAALKENADNVQMRLRNKT